MPLLVIAFFEKEVLAAQQESQAASPMAKVGHGHQKMPVVGQQPMHLAQKMARAVKMLDNFQGRDQAKFGIISLGKWAIQIQRPWRHAGQAERFNIKFHCG